VDQAACACCHIVAGSDDDTDNYVVDDGDGCHGDGCHDDSTFVHWVAGS